MSFIACPDHVGPIYWRFVPIIVSTGFTFSNISAFPQINIVSSPVIAFGVLPVTGASIKYISFSDNLSPIFFAHSTQIVDISTTTLPGLSAPTVPSNQKKISSTSSPAVTIVISISTVAARSFFLLQIFAPRVLSSFARSGVRFQTERSPHFARIFFAIGRPISPSPINPIRI